MIPRTEFGFVVAGVYAFMAVFGYTVNVVTATIAAIAVGVGIDFSTHFTARFREELDGEGGRLDAVRRAGAGTGGALVLSALTSVLGFLIMATPYLGAVFLLPFSVFFRFLGPEFLRQFGSDYDIFLPAAEGEL